MEKSRIKKLEETVEKIKVQTHPLDMRILRTTKRERAGEKLTAREKRIVKGACSVKIDLTKIISNYEKIPKEKSTDERLKDEIAKLQKEKGELLVESISTKEQCRK